LTNIGDEAENQKHLNIVVRKRNPARPVLQTDACPDCAQNSSHICHSETHRRSQSKWFLQKRKVAMYDETPVSQNAIARHVKSKKPKLQE
jgi:hypothetical protein